MAEEEEKKLEDMTAKELMDHAKNMGRDEVQGLVDEITPTLKKLKAKVDEWDLADKIEDFFEDKLDDLKAIRELIQDKKAEMKADAVAEAEKAKPKGKMSAGGVKLKALKQSLKPEDWKAIINGYDKADKGSKTQYLKDVKHPRTGEAMPITANNIEGEKYGWRKKLTDLGLLGND
ncbi:MAG: hypothetical protein ABJ263_01190 [Tateyamaria sp.]|uniref:hypothetical protein n=1 Tax=Tateyamaria sp. TaxID=1929288 RepID=UPI0032800F27